MIEVRGLDSSESYNISAAIVSSNYDVTFLGTKIFTTLMDDYQPDNITDLWVEEFEPIDGKFLNAVLGWKPGRGKVSEQLV